MGLVNFINNKIAYFFGFTDFFLTCATYCALKLISKIMGNPLGSELTISTLMISGTIVYDKAASLSLFLSPSISCLFFSEYCLHSCLLCFALFILDVLLQVFG